MDCCKNLQNNGAGKQEDVLKSKRAAYGKTAKTRKDTEPGHRHVLQYQTRIQQGCLIVVYIHMKTNIQTNPSHTGNKTATPETATLEQGCYTGNKAAIRLLH